MFSASKPQMVAAGNRMEKANHLVTQNSSWVADEIGNHLSEYTVMFECSHGSATHFRDATCLYNLSLPVEEHKVSSIIVSDAVSAKKDSSWSYVIPPYNLVVLNSCSSAGGSFKWDFGISGDARVCVGWDLDIWAGRMTFWNIKFWNLLAHGSEVLEAAISGCTPIDLFGPSPGGCFPVIQGDPRTKLHGVYQGNGTQWAIPLNP